MEDTRLGSILLESGFVSEADLERCLSIQTLTGSVRPIGQVLVEQGLVEPATLERVLELQGQRTRECAVKAAPADALSSSLLASARVNRAEEMIVSEGRTVRIRIGDEWRALTKEIVAGPEVWDFAREVVGHQVLEEVAEHRCVLRPWQHGLHGRGSARVFRHFEGVAVRLTFVPEAVETADIGIADRVLELARAARGLILIAGERGVGRVEAMAALANAAAQDPGTHVLVLDDEPMPLGRTPALLGRCRFGGDAANRAAAVRSAVREDPDVLVIADVGEAATFEIALRAAEDGRLVIGYLDASSVAAAISRVLDFYAVYDVPRVRASLATVLRALVVRHHIMQSSGEESVVATELLIPDEPVSNAMRGGELADVTLMMRMEGSRCGHSLDRSMLDLVTSGQISLESAFARAEERAWLLERTKGRQAVEK